MTGFGGANVRENGISVFAEIKTVNNRYLKFSLRTTDGYGALEPVIENLVRETLRRGTVTMNVRILREDDTADYEINEQLLTHYLQQLRRLNAKLGLNGSFVPAQLLTLPGVTKESIPSDDKTNIVRPVVETAVKKALAELQTMRQNEGTSMIADLRENSRFLTELISKIELRVPEVAEQFRLHLNERIGKIMAEQNLPLAPADLVREVALFVDRSDISEEIVRFKSHTAQLDAVLQDENPKDGCGRRLDFLTQEMFREVNTIGSKANDAEITKIVVELKIVIERIREMVQNVE
jgi:uncharacterized protein (TIGR00255 family)